MVEPAVPLHGPRSQLFTFLAVGQHWRFLKATLFVGFLSDLYPDLTPAFVSSTIDLLNVTEDSSLCTHCLLALPALLQSALIAFALRSLFGADAAV